MSEKFQIKDIGRRYLFCLHGEPDKEFSFSSSLDNIGNKDNHDRSLKNNTTVMLLSGEFSAQHPVAGHLKVVKVIAEEQSMWVPAHSLMEIN